MDEYVDQFLILSAYKVPQDSSPHLALHFTRTPNLVYMCLLLFVERGCAIEVDDLNK